MASWSEDVFTEREAAAKTALAGLPAGDTEMQEPRSCTRSIGQVTATVKFTSSIQWIRCADGPDQGAFFDDLAKWSPAIRRLHEIDKHGSFDFLISVKHRPSQRFATVVPLNLWARPTPLRANRRGNRS